MRRSDLEAYVNRDWRAAEAESVDYWRRVKSESTPAALFALVDQFVAGLRAMRPDWPSEAERAADLASHIAVADLLRRAHRDVRP